MQRIYKDNSIMIAKINHGSSLYGAVLYNQQKVDKGEARVIHTHRMIVPGIGQTDTLFQKTLLSFEPYLAANRRTKNPVVHISLNPDPGDRVTDGKLAMLAGDYMDKMGYGCQPYIVYKHSDIDRAHIHIVTVNVTEEGAKISDSYEKLRSMKTCRELEKVYGLKQIDSEKEPEEEKRFYQKEIDYKKGDIKRRMSNTIKTLLANYKFQTLGEYNALLSVYNIQARHVRGEEEWNLYNGIIYSVTDAKGLPVGVPVKSSLISKAAGYEALVRKMARTAKTVKEKGLCVPQAEMKIAAAMKPGVTRKQFIKELKREGIDVVFRQNGEGRIYGVTFIDHANRTAFNGSRLGKGFSANAFQKLFNGEAGQQEKPAWHAPASIDEVFGTLYPETVRYDAEEEAFRRKMRRKKKQQRRI